MTIVGAGGVVIARIQRRACFDRDYKKLSAEIQARMAEKLSDLLTNPRPPGLRFEKLKGYSAPAIYSLHITGNYKLSFEIEGNTAILRRLAPHDEIDRAP